VGGEKVIEGDKMKKLGILLCILLLIAIVGCDLSNEEQGTTDSDYVRNTPRYYHPQSFRIDPYLDLSWHGAFFLHQDRLHLYGLDDDDATGITYFVVLTMDAIGTNIQEMFRTPLDEAADFFGVLGFDICEDGYISLVMQDIIILPPYTKEDVMQGVYPFEQSITFVYRRISPDGEIVDEFGIDALNEDERDIFIDDAKFDLEGNVIARAWWLPANFVLPPDAMHYPEDVGGFSLFFFDNGLKYGFTEVEDEWIINGFARGEDGQIIGSRGLSAGGKRFTLFYEIDFENTAVADGAIVEAGARIGGVKGVFPAPTKSAFDFYIVEDMRIFGYTNSTETFTSLINLNELGIGTDTNIGSRRGDMLFWDDGRITLVVRAWNEATWQVERTLFLLTPSDEPWFSNREIITIGGVYIGNSPLVSQVSEFNRQSHTHQIEIINYSSNDMDRLRVELVTGRGPDIFMLSWWGADFLAELAETIFLLDLYPMIDADPILNRDDFFPSVLSSWENSRGELVKLAPDFSIQTLMGMSADFPHAPDAWTYADFIAFYQNAREEGFPYPFGQTLDRLHLLDILLFTDETFFSQREGTANFDSDSFIAVLNFVMSIPEDQGWDRVTHLSLAGEWDPVGNLLNREQRLLPFANINGLTHFRALQTRLGGITAFGFPAAETPVHAVQVPSGTAVGIRANSIHIDAAWEFVRMGMVSNVFMNDNVLPVKIDLFDQLISDELGRGEPATFTFPIGGAVVEMPPMTEADAILLRELIANVGHAPVNEHPIQQIIYEDVIPFFAGERSAEDTARIIQSRAEIYLSERTR